MPIIRFEKSIFYYCHIPKCAGTAVEDYLMQSNCKIAFLDRSYLAPKAGLRKWCHSSPQHINGEFIDQLFPQDFFDGVFAIVRDPIERFKSAYSYAMRNSPFPPTKSINEFALDALPKNFKRIGWYDNHFLPQTFFIPARRDCKLFSLSDNGITSLKKYIETDIVQSSLKQEIPFKNRSGIKPPEINQKTTEIVHDIYSSDFDLYNASLRGDSVSIDSTFQAQEISFSGKFPYLVRRLVKLLELRLKPTHL